MHKASGGREGAQPTSQAGRASSSSALPLQLNKKCDDDDEDAQDDDVASAIATCAVSLRRLCAWAGERERAGEKVLCAALLPVYPSGISWRRVPSQEAEGEGSKPKGWLSLPFLWQQLFHVSPQRAELDLTSHPHFPLPIPSLSACTPPRWGCLVSSLCVSF